MKRTSIVLPADLRARAKRRAKERGVSFAELVRSAVAREVSEGPEERDPIFEVTILRGRGRRDGSTNHELMGRGSDPHD